jgi:integrase
VILASYRLQRATVVHQFRRILDAAGIAGGKTGYHSLRTTFVTRCESAGIPRPLIQSMVGHSAGQMTGHYSEAVATQDQIAMIARRQTVDGKTEKML